MKIKMKQCGFTTKELIIVLPVIIALIVLIIAPSFDDAFDDARTSETKLVSADFERAINTIRMQWSAEGGQKDRIEFNGSSVEVTSSGWAKQLNASVAGCMTIWNSVLESSPEIEVYDREVHSNGWSVGGGPNVCYFINQQGVAFEDEETPYFRYSYEIGQITRFNM